MKANENRGRRLTWRRAAEGMDGRVAVESEEIGVSQQATLMRVEKLTNEGNLIRGLAL